MHTCMLLSCQLDQLQLWPRAVGCQSGTITLVPCLSLHSPAYHPCLSVRLAPLWGALPAAGPNPQLVSQPIGPFQNNLNQGNVILKLCLAGMLPCATDWQFYAACIGEGGDSAYLHHEANATKCHGKFHILAYS